jgi:hypothetical protein
MANFRRTCALLASAMLFATSTRVHAAVPNSCCECLCSSAMAAPMKRQPDFTTLDCPRAGMCVESCTKVCNRFCEGSGGVRQRPRTLPEACVPPAPVQAASLESAIEHCIAHEGENPWVGDTDDIRPAATLRAQYRRCQARGLASGRMAVDQATDEELVFVTKSVVQACSAKYAADMMKPGDGWFDWSWKHGEQANMWVSLNKDNNVTGIRDRFTKPQHNDNIRNTIYCFSSSEVRKLAERVPYPPPPPPTRPPLPEKSFAK